MSNTYGINFIKIGGSEFSEGQKPPIRGLTIIERSLKLCEAAFSSYYIWFKFHQNRRYLNFLGGGGVHLTCDGHFRTRMSYSSQKSCVKIWFGLVELGGMLIFRWGGGGQKSPISGVTCDLRCPFPNLAELFQPKVTCKNLVRSG